MRKRIQNIVESKWCATGSNKIVAGCNLLSTNQQEKLHKLLNTFAHLFDGTLENRNTDLINFEIKDNNEKPYHTKGHIKFHTLKNNS
jgi:hypothetical protein